MAERRRTPRGPKGDDRGPRKFEGRGDRERRPRASQERQDGDRRPRLADGNTPLRRRDRDQGPTARPWRANEDQRPRASRDFERPRREGRDDERRRFDAPRDDRRPRPTRFGAGGGPAREDRRPRSFDSRGPRRDFEPRRSDDQRDSRPRADNRRGEPWDRERKPDGRGRSYTSAPRPRRSGFDDRAPRGRNDRFSRDDAPRTRARTSADDRPNTRGRAWPRSGEGEGRPRWQQERSGGDRSATEGRERRTGGARAFERERPAPRRGFAPNRREEEAGRPPRRATKGFARGADHHDDDPFKSQPFDDVIGPLDDDLDFFAPDQEERAERPKRTRDDAPRPRGNTPRGRGPTNFEKPRPRTARSADIPPRVPKRRIPDDIRVAHFTKGEPVVPATPSPTADGLPCPHFPDCVGCPFIGRPYTEQLAAKREIVREAFAAYPALAEIEIPEVVGSPTPFGYRNQVKLVARRARRGLLLGVYRPGSHQVVDIHQCPVHHPLINSVLEGVMALVDEHGVWAYDERRGNGELRYVIVRVGTWSKTVQVILVTKSDDLPQARQLARDIRKLHGVVSVVQNINAEPGNVILGKEFRLLVGDEALMEKLDGFKIFTHPGAFIQANPNVAGKIYRTATEWAALTENEIAIDLYCGVGVLSLHLAAQARTVFGVEESSQAVVDAKMNARMNGVGNSRFRCGDVASVLPELLSDLGRADVVALNPPRKGADDAARAAILAADPSRILYVSCDPTTMARDIDWFAAHGFRCERLQPYDMLPQTEHVECLALLRKV